MATVEEMAVSLGAEFSQEYRRAVSVLGQVGLTDYEARAYIALVARGIGDAAAIAQAAGIPRRRPTRSSNRWRRRTTHSRAGGKPLLFKPRRPIEVAESLKGSIQEVFEKLEALHDIAAEHGEPQLVYLLNGREKVIGKIADLLDQSTKTFILTTPQVSDIRDELGKKFAHAVKRGVEVTFVTAPLQKIPEGVRVIPRNNLLATEVLADNQHALLAGPNLEAAGFTDNPILTAHLQQFLEIILDRGTENKP